MKFGLENNSQYQSQKYLVSKKSLGIDLENFGLKKSLGIGLNTTSSRSSTQEKKDHWSDWINTVNQTTIKLKYLILLNIERFTNIIL